MGDLINTLTSGVVNNKKAQTGGMIYVNTYPNPLDNVYLSKIYAPSFMPTFLVEPWLSLGYLRPAARRIKYGFRNNFFTAQKYVNDANNLLNNKLMGKNVTVAGLNDKFTVAQNLGGNYYSLNNISNPTTTETIYHLVSLVLDQNQTGSSDFTSQQIQDINNKLANARLYVNQLIPYSVGDLTITMDYQNTRTIDNIGGQSGKITAANSNYYTVNIGGKDYSRYHILSLRNNLLN